MLNKDFRLIETFTGSSIGLRIFWESKKLLHIIIVSTNRFSQKIIIL